MCCTDVALISVTPELWMLRAVRHCCGPAAGYLEVTVVSLDEKKILCSVKRGPYGRVETRSALGVPRAYTHRDLQPTGLTATPRSNRRHAQSDSDRTASTLCAWSSSALWGKRFSSSSLPCRDTYGSAQYGRAWRLDFGYSDTVGWNMHSYPSDL